jgi:hypothetical protein
VINAQEDSSIEAPIPNMFFSSSNLASSVVVVATIVLGFGHSNHTIKNEITTLASYSDANMIAFPHPTKPSIIHKALKCGST